MLKLDANFNILFFFQEPELESGQARNSFSYVILALTFVLCLTANQKSV